LTTPKAPRKYAENTKVDQESTLRQIRDQLRKRKADGFMSGDERGRAVIGFRHSGRVYRFDLPMPDLEDHRKTPTGVRRTDPSTVTAWQQQCNRRFRALLATIMARLIAVDEGISTFEQEFGMETVMADGRTTVRQYLMPQLEEMHRSGAMPPLLPGPKA